MWDIYDYVFTTLDFPVILDGQFISFKCRLHHQSVDEHVKRFALFPNAGLL
jgi:hypothetical protein